MFDYYTSLIAELYNNIRLC